MEHQPEHNSAQERVRQYLQAVLTETGWSAPELARRAGISRSTLHRALTEDIYTTSTTTLEKIARASGINLPGSRIATTARELQPDENVNGGAIAPHQSWQRVSTNLLMRAGMMPGDILLLDAQTTPRQGDIVEAEIFTAAGAHTALRLYDAPYLVTRAAGDDEKPVLVDGEHVMIRAVVIERRWRRPA
jgi:lambda repressor-like predicted transcriptional regulator